VGQEPPEVVKGVRDHAVPAVRSEATTITYESATDTPTVVLRPHQRGGKVGRDPGLNAEARLIALEVLDAWVRVDAVDTAQLQVIPKPGVNGTWRRNDP
jgi:hypothetical protein